ncbi:MAG: response regulator [Lachnospiraceae bacterium]|nr:response regulator [Lachnospiraceae bacterium]
MEKKHIMVTGQKETFVVRVLLKKLQDAGISYEFVNLTVNDINARWEGTSLVVLFMDAGARSQEDALRFLFDKMIDSGISMIPIGDKEDVQFVQSRAPKEQIYRTFIRPVEHEEFLAAVKELFQKIEAGDFKKSILIVDDDPGYMGLVREWLKGTYKVAMANSGLQALKWLGKNKADLILLDYEMPVTSGPQVLEMLRSDEDTRNIPVMFLTGKGDKQSVMKVVALKPEGYFLKTIAKEDLMQKLAEFFAVPR